MTDTRTIRVEFDCDIPADTSDEHIIEWLRFELGEQGSLRADNPLMQDIEARRVDYR